MEKERHGFVTFWLWLIIICSVMILFGYVLIPDIITHPISRLLSLSYCICTIFSAILILNWINGFWLYIVGSILYTYTVFQIGLNIFVNIILAIIGIFIFYGILTLKKNGISTWDYLTGKNLQKSNNNESNSSENTEKRGFMKVFKDLNEQIKKLNGKSGMVIKVYLIISLIFISVSVIKQIEKIVDINSNVPVFNVQIRDTDVLDRITQRINEEGVNVIVSRDNVVRVADQATARRMRVILIMEDLVPAGAKPWQIFDTESWTTTDLERKVKLQRSLTNQIIENIKAIDGVDNAIVMIVFPENELFSFLQNPITASVIILPRPGSDITQNRKKVEGIQKLLKTMIEGLKDENITITDNKGHWLNDFDGMKEFDKQPLLTERQAKYKREMEKKDRELVLSLLQSTFTKDRIRNLKVDYEIGFDQETYERKELLPTMIKERTPGLPYDDSERTMTEGQTPPAFKDMQNLYGEMNQDTKVTNHEWSHQDTKRERAPKILRKTVSVNIDGVNRPKYDEKGKKIVNPDDPQREYIPVSDKDLADAKSLIQNVIGYDAIREDEVSVTNIKFDRSEQFKREDKAIQGQEQLKTTVLVFLAALTLLLFGFILFRAISREMERRKRKHHDNG